MKFSTREDIAAPIDHVFAQISDFAAFERQALRRGADVQRLDAGDVTTGTRWDIAFGFRGKDRKVRAELTALDAPNMLRVDSEGKGIVGVTLLELIALSPSRTRLAMSIELSPNSLAARLMLQSLKLAKSSLTARFKKRIAGYAEDIENNYRPAS